MRRLAVVLWVSLNAAGLAGLAVGLDLWLDSELDPGVALVLLAAALYTVGNHLCTWLYLRRRRREEAMAG